MLFLELINIFNVLRGFIFVLREQILNYNTSQNFLLALTFDLPFLAKEFRIGQWGLKSVDFILFGIHLPYHVSHFGFVPYW